MKTQPDVDHLTTGDLRREEKKRKKNEKKRLQLFELLQIGLANLTLPKTWILFFIKPPLLVGSI